MLRRATRDLARLGLRSDGEIVDRARQILREVEDVQMTEATVKAIIGR